MVTEVCLAFEVAFHKAFNRVPAKQIGISGKPFLQGFQKQHPQWSSQPLVSGNVESDFLPTQNCPRQLLLHQLLQQELLVLAPDFQMSGQSRRKFHNTMVKERWPHFDRMCHAHAVALGENVVGEKVLLIEPEERRQIVIGRWQVSQFGNDFLEGAW